MANIHDQFKQLKGHLAIDGKGKPDKFCSICGHRLPSSKTLLERHFSGQHPGQVAEFLRYDLKPKECKYTNFDAYLEDPSV